MTLLESNTGGSGVYARGLLGALRARDDMDVDVVASPRGGGAGTASWMLAGARKAASAAGDDLLHSPGFLIPFRVGTPLVITIHDLSLAKMPQGHPLEWRLYYQLVFPALVRTARAVITPTEATRQDVIAELRVEPSRVTVTPYGVSDRFFRSESGTGPASAPPTVLFSGPPIKRKNLDAVLRVLASPPSGGVLESARLKISGATAADFPAYATWIRDHGLESRVEWLGVVPSEELPALYASASVFVYPSFLEGFGFPPLEAMAAGTPVVASNASCLPEVLGSGALLIDPSDDAGLALALEHVLREQAVRARLVNAGREWVRKYTWQRCGDLTADVYRRVAGVA